MRNTFGQIAYHYYVKHVRNLLAVLRNTLVKYSLLIDTHGVVLLAAQGARVHHGLVWVDNVVGRSGIPGTLVAWVLALTRLATRRWVKTLDYINIKLENAILLI